MEQSVVVTPWSTIGALVFNRTYTRRVGSEKDSRTETFPETVDRIIRSTETQLKCGFSPYEQDHLRTYLLSLKAFVAGRFMAQLGAPTVDRLGLASLQNCFSPDEEFITSDGIKRFSDFEDGDEVVVRGRKGWKAAVVKCFGDQPLATLTVRKGSRTKVINTTPNHRWILEDNTIVTTATLSKGDRLRTLDKGTNFHHIDPCKIGIQHGLVFGDGHYERTANACAIIPCGDAADEVRSFFWQDKGDKGIYGLPNFWKELPRLDSNKHYLLGFLAGWFAADGSLAADGSCVVLANKDPEVLNWARGALAKLCITCSDITLSREISPFDGSYKPLYRMTLDRENLPAPFFLLSKHRNRYTPLKSDRTWVVESTTGEDEEGWGEVWCVIEPENEEFVLANGILTKNCAGCVVDTPRAFTWAFDLLMLGSGVGYNIQRKYVSRLPKVNAAFEPAIRDDTGPVGFNTPDTREGWVDLLGYVLDGAFSDATSVHRTFSVRDVRPSGEVIKGFGGIASGPEPLCEGIGHICSVLYSRRGKQLRPIDALDIMNIIGQIVVSGNVRRSAQIAIGDVDDLEFLNAKRWDGEPYPSWRQYSNNSVVWDGKSELPEDFWAGYTGKGEPYGLINLDLARAVGRAGETQYPDPDLVVFNPCAEQGLANYETCALAELNLPAFKHIGELTEAAELLYRVVKRSLTLPCHLPETEAIVHKNMRMGIGVTGYAQATEEQRGWLPELYKFLRWYDYWYSRDKGLPTSIKLTTVKPSGTLSLLPGVTPGCHPGYAQYMIRRIRIASDSPLLDIVRKNGYTVEPARAMDGSVDERTMVAEFPFSYPEGTTLAKDVTAIDQLDTVRRLQREWSDNAVSCTIYFRPEELEGIKAYLREHFADNFKSLSFLLHSEHGFLQAPISAITKDEYDDLVARTTPLTDSMFLTSDEVDLGQLECSNGICPVV